MVFNLRRKGAFRIVLLIFVIASTLIYSSIVLNIHVEPSELIEQLHNYLPQNKSSSKRILMWNNYWTKSSSLWERVFFRILSRQCSENLCEFVYNRELVDLADVVIFHPIDMKPKYEVPQHRPIGQIWMRKWKVDIGKLPEVNWTMTYHTNSDIVVPYGIVKKLDEEVEYDLDIWSRKNKKKLVTWLVSDCKTPGNREGYAKILKEHISMDIFGKCSKYHCGKPLNMNEFSKKEDMQNNCFDAVQRYMFYLSFENSICNDYVTEKFFKFLQLDVVPIVFGGANYSAIAPPNSYIDALQFTPQNLAEHLKNVANNQTLYNSYFKWKTSYTVEVGDPFLPFVCDLCSKLHSKPLQHKYERLSENLTSKEPAHLSTADWLLSSSECKQWNPPNTLRPIR